LYHFDPTGLNLSKAQSGKLKAIQGGSGYPDLNVLEPRGQHHGLHIEIKPDGTRLFKKNGQPASEHIGNQATFLFELTKRGYFAVFAVGFDQVKETLDLYLKL
jgi:hypothetical protein